MRTINVKREVPANRTAVWGVLADFPNIADWNTGVKTSLSTSNAVEGVGAQRHCDLTPMGSLEETVAGWTPESQMVVTIDSTSKLPIKNGEVTFDLHPESETQTTVTVEYKYTTKFGPIGRLMGPILDKQLTAGFQGFLSDLEAAAISH